MANEFKIRKGLIVEGATGGTVVDVQGSLGQLFSVTDNLTGEIFAVADISGVPIMTINSSSSTVFTGLVSGITPVNAANFVTKAYADGLTPGTGVFVPLSGGSGVGQAMTGDLYISKVQPLLTVISTSGADASINIGRNGDTLAKITAGDTAASDFNIYTGGSIRQTILSNGNVGIGVTGPSRKFQIDQSSTTAGGAYVYSNAIHTGTTTNSLVSIRQDNASASGTVLDVRGDGSGDKLIVWEGTDVSLIVKDGGNVGIGTDTPGAKLHIVSTTNADGILLTGDGTATGMGTGQGRSIDFQYTKTDSSFGSALRFNIPNDTVHGGALTFHTDDTVGALQQAMLINQFQNVGIGSTSPTEAKLVVEGTSEVIAAFGRDGTDGDIVQVYNGLAGTTKVIALGASGNDGTIYSQFGDIILQPTAGNVGIGTTTPLAKLDVQGTQGQLFSVTDDLSGEIFAVADISGVPIMTVNSSGLSTFTGLVSGITPVNAANFVTKAYVDGSGGGSGGPYLPVANPTFTGVLTGPSADLQFIKLTAANPGILMKETDTTDKNWDIQVNSGNLKFYEVNDARSVFSEKVTFEAGGNVGISVTNPVGPLDVFGSAVQNGSTPGIKLSSSNTQQTVFAIGNTGTRQYELAVGGTTSSVPGAFYVYDNNAADFRMVISTAGNIGITETNPLHKLSIKSTDNTRGILINNTSTSSYAELHLKANREYRIGTGGSATAADAKDNFYIYDATAATHRVTLTSAGDFGIGTFAPGYKLDVAGTIRATGDVIAYSDERVKENIKTIDNALNKVNKLRGVEFNKIGEDIKSIGVIAQEIEKVIPEVVREDDKGMKSVAYGNITGVLIEAIKELKAEIEELKKQIK